MAGNMESMLLGSDSSSSDGSDNEDEVVDAGTVPTSAAAAAVAVTAVARPPAPAPAAAPVTAPAATRSVPAAAKPVPAPAPMPETAARPSSSQPLPAAGAPPASPAAAATGPTPGMSQSDISARLKSLYSPASKAAPPPAGHPAPVAAPPPPPAAAPAPRAAAPAPLPARPPVATAPLPSHPHPSSATYQQRAAAAAVAAGLAPRPAATAGAPVSAAAPAPTTTSAMPGAAAVAAHRQRSASAASGVRASGMPAPAAAPGASAPAPAGSGGGDPFEPTPLKAMMHRQARVAAGLPPEPVAPPVPGAAPVAGARRGAVVVPGGLGPGSAQATPASSVTSAVGSTTASAAAPVRSSSISSVPSVPSVPPTSVPSVGSSAGSVGSSMGSSVKPMDRATLEREAKQRKEKFLMFTRVLMKYLEQKDPGMHVRAKAVIKECAEKNKKKEAGYHSLTASMQTRLRATVGDVYWRKAEDYLNHFLKQKLQQARQEAAARGKPAPLPAAPGAQPAPVPSPLRPTSASSVSATVPSAVAAPASGPAQIAVAKTAAIAPAPGAVPPAHAASQNVIDQQERDRAAARKKIAEIERQAAEAQKARERDKATAAFRKEQLKADRRKKQMEAKAIAAQNKAKEKTERDRARAAERSAAKANNAKLLQMQHESAKLAALQGKALGVGVPSPLPPVATPAPAVTSPSSSTASGLVKSPDVTSITSSASTKKKKPAEKKKASATKASAAAAAAAAAKAAAEAKAEPPPREYAELMEMVDHAVSYDWSSAASILGREHKGDVNIDEEQRHLLYGDDGRTGAAGGMQRQLGVGGGTVEGSAASTSYPGSPPGGLGIRTHSINAPATLQQPATAESSLPPALRGWNRRNVISARTAWAKVRLPEQEKERTLAVEKGVSFVPQGVGGFTLPGFHRGAANAATRRPSLAGTTETGWFNDEKAEEDSTLALLSEATDMYLKSILEGAVKAARQRQNLDGIRIWHRQHGPSKPPLSLRLGCDVRRQVALREGNDAKTCQRMEEALARQGADKKRSRVDDELMLFNATSMSDLSRRPKLKGAAAKADYDGKRKFEVFGGKGSGAPPLGRVPKEAKITPRDFRLCLEDPLFPHKRKGAIMSPAFM